MSYLFLPVAMALDRAIQRLFGICRHEGRTVGVGQIVVTEKRNKPEKAIDGLWRVRRCERCGEPFSNPDDRVDA